MQPFSLERCFDNATYTDLASVEAADRAVRANDALTGFLTGAAGILHAHGMARRFGIGLLHRHNALQPGERMVELEGTVDAEPALVTRPVHDGAAACGVPSVWATVAGGFRPLEYTTDPGAVSCYAGDVPAAFLDDFHAFASASPVGRFLGLAVVDRGFYDGAAPDEVALELSNLIERANVVFMRPRDTTGAKAIATAWALRRQTYDPVLGCYDPRECLRSCVTDSGTGQHRQHHRPGPGEHLPT